MNKICIIPARGGSKRIPRKNIRNFFDKPIIAYSIDAAISSQLFDEVMVSTDDPEIAKVAKEYGAAVPFMRSPKNSDDAATTYEVIKEVIEAYRAKGVDYDFTCCIYATAPTIKVQNLKNAFNLIKDGKFSGALPVVKYSYPIQRALSIDADERIRMNLDQNLKAQSQSLSDFYHDAGQFYFYRTAIYLSEKSIFKMNTKPIIISELEAQDIDTLTDWKLAEMKYNLMNSN